MRIIEVNPEAIDLIEAKILDDFSEVQIPMVEVNTVKICTKANIRVTITKVIITKAIMVCITTHVEIINNNITNYCQFRGTSHGCGRGNYHRCSHSRSNYQGNNNYQYHQYYGHDDECQMDQYGPPCTLCSGYNHSPKHCFKGEHDINDIMEKMNISGHQSQLSDLYT